MNPVSYAQLASFELLTEDKGLVTVTKVFNDGSLKTKPLCFAPLGTGLKIVERINNRPAIQLTFPF